MGKINVEVCEVCRSEDCDGKKYETNATCGGKRIVCSADEHLVRTVDGLEYKQVVGHGEVEYHKVKEVK